MSEEPKSQAAAPDAAATSKPSKPDEPPAAPQADSYLPELVAYRAMEDAAAEIATALTDAKTAKLPANAKILLINDMDLICPQANAWQVERQVQSMTTLLDELLTKYCQPIRITALETLLTTEILEVRELEEPGKEEEEEPAPSMLAPLMDFLGPAAEVLQTTEEILAHFQPEVEFSGGKISLPDQGLNALIAGRLERDVYLWDFYNLDFTHISILTAYNTAVDKRNRLTTCKARYTAQAADLAGRIAVLNEQIEAAGDDAARAKDLTSQRDTLTARKDAVQAITAEISAVVQIFDTFSAAVAGQQGCPPYAPLLRAAVQQYVDSLGITHYLYTSVLSSGGENIVVKTMKLFFTLPLRSIAGGCVANYYLMEAATSRILHSGTAMGQYATDFKFDWGTGRFYQRDFSL